MEVYKETEMLLNINNYYFSLFKWKELGKAVTESYSTKKRAYTFIRYIHLQLAPLHYIYFQIRERGRVTAQHVFDFEIPQYKEKLEILII